MKGDFTCLPLGPLFPTGPGIPWNTMRWSHLQTNLIWHTLIIMSRGASSIWTLLSCVFSRSRHSFGNLSLCWELLQITEQWQFWQHSALNSPCVFVSVTCLDETGISTIVPTLRNTMRYKQHLQLAIVLTRPSVCKMSEACFYSNTFTMEVYGVSVQEPKQIWVELSCWVFKTWNYFSEMNKQSSAASTKW